MALRELCYMYLLPLDNPAHPISKAPSRSVPLDRTEANCSENVHLEAFEVGTVIGC